MLNEKRGLVARVTVRGIEYCLFKTSEAHYLITGLFGGSFQADNDDDAMLLFAKFYGVSIEQLVA